MDSGTNIQIACEGSTKNINLKEKNLILANDEFQPVSKKKIKYLLRKAEGTGDCSALEEELRL